MLRNAEIPLSESMREAIAGRVRAQTQFRDTLIAQQRQDMQAGKPPRPPVLPPGSEQHRIENGKMTLGQALTLIDAHNELTGS